ncbi:methyl-accepting chemotaxis protein [Cohnella caldifontis]|uniref:methyl-accepting chemotaxis protein n=1 Tax=Cohnella caldifontis TaxID=3027471 RepID=UPI0023ED114F|nr:HAMP domain-containing methyl-accepting chemotaxis protein [Cohnella sp. YIM B05605]
MSSSLSVRTKLLLMLLIPLLLLAGIVVYLLQVNASNTKRLSEILYESAYQSSSLALNADRDMYQALTAYMTAQHASGSARDAAVKDLKDNAAQAGDRLKRTTELIRRFGLENVLKAEDGRPFLEVLTQAALQFEQWAASAQDRLDRNDFPADQEQSLLGQFNRSRENINAFTDAIDAYAQDRTAAIKRENDNSRVQILASVSVEWVVLLLLGFLFVRQISRAVRAILDRTRRVAEGDLRTPPETKYARNELGAILQSVDVMTANMKTLIGQIKENTLSVSESSRQLSAGARDSADSADQVARNIQEVAVLVDRQTAITSDSSKAISEMAIGVQRIAENTGTVSDHAATTSRQAETGNEQLLRLETQLDQISQSMDELGRSIAVLTEKSEQIGSITGKITGFANQTNILALNAGIEAARAGEQGKGFAVVAVEIRKLAAGSLESAAEIEELIGETRGEIERTSERMQTAIRQTEQGSAIMKEAAAGFETILASIREVADQIQDSSAVTEQMSASSQELTAGMEQAAASAGEISRKAQNVSSATEEQLALSEGLSKTSEQMEEIIERLNRAVVSFKL